MVKRSDKVIWPVPDYARQFKTAGAAHDFAIRHYDSWFNQEIRLFEDDRGEYVLTLTDYEGDSTIPQELCPAKTFPSPVELGFENGDASHSEITVYVTVADTTRPGTDSLVPQSYIRFADAKTWEKQMTAKVVQAKKTAKILSGAWNVEQVGGGYLKVYRSRDSDPIVNLDFHLHTDNWKLGFISTVTLGLAETPQFKDPHRWTQPEAWMRVVSVG